MKAARELKSDPSRSDLRRADAPAAEAAAAKEASAGNRLPATTTTAAGGGGSEASDLQAKLTKLRALSDADKLLITNFQAKIDEQKKECVSRPSARRRSCGRPTPHRASLLAWRHRRRVGVRPASAHPPAPALCAPRAARHGLPRALAERQGDGVCARTTAACTTVLTTPACVCARVFVMRGRLENRTVTISAIQRNFENLSNGAAAERRELAALREGEAARRAEAEASAAELARLHSELRRLVGLQEGQSSAADRAAEELATATKAAAEERGRLHAQLETAAQRQAALERRVKEEGARGRTS